MIGAFIKVEVLNYVIKVIGPKCSKDGRSKVVEQYCNILSLIPTFRVTGTFCFRFYIP